MGRNPRARPPLDDERRWLCEAHVPHAMLEVRKFARPWLDADEIESAALWGLTLAACDHRGEAKFWDYASNRVRGEILKYFARMRLHVSREAIAPDLADLTPDDGPCTLAAVDEAETLTTRINRLPPLRRSVATLAAEGLDCAEIARRLGLTRSQAMQRLKGCRKFLTPPIRGVVPAT